MASSPISIERRKGVGLVSVDSLSALDVLAQPLADALHELSEDEAVRAILLHAPQGITPTVSASGKSAVTVMNGDSCTTPAGLVASIRKATIAFIEGDCLDEAFELALACDIRIAGPQALFGLGHVRRGALPQGGGTQRLTRLVGRAHALRMLLTGDSLDAEEALRIGLAQRVGTLEEAIALAERIASAAPIAVEYAKEAVVQGVDLALAQGLRLEADLSFLLQSTSDRGEGLRSFRERTPSRYEGR